MTQVNNIQKQIKPLKKGGISIIYYLKNDPIYSWVIKIIVNNYEFCNEISDCFVKN